LATQHPGFDLRAMAHHGSRLALFSVCILLIFAHAQCRFGVFKSKGTQRAVELRPGIGLTSQTIALNVEVIRWVRRRAQSSGDSLTPFHHYLHRYRPVELVPSKSYEVRVSAPATVRRHPQTHSYLSLTTLLTRPSHFHRYLRPFICGWSPETALGPPPVATVNCSMLKKSCLGQEQGEASCLMAKR
jgi:hypothetical protein